MSLPVSRNKYVYGVRLIRERRWSRLGQYDGKVADQAIARRSQYGMSAGSPAVRLHRPRCIGLFVCVARLLFRSRECSERAPVAGAETGSQL
jgi:hypothetical protein